MEVRFRDKDLDRLEVDPKFEGGYPQALVKAFRKRMQVIRAAEDERAFYALKSLHFEKLVGDRYEQHSMRLNDQWRLILELVGTNTDKVVVVVSIEDYH
jgi:proteic killer suppression protein